MCWCPGCLVVCSIFSCGILLCFISLRKMGHHPTLGHFLYNRICQSKTAFFDLSPIDLSYTVKKVEKGLFRPNFFRLRIPTGGSSRITRLVRLDPPVENSVEKVLHVFFEPIASFFPPPNTHPHGHAATHPYQAPHCSIMQGADAGVAITAVASRSKSAWRIPSSARQQCVSHDAAAHAIDPMLPTTAAHAVALAGLG